MSTIRISNYEELVNGLNEAKDDALRYKPIYILFDQISVKIR